MARTTKDTRSDRNQRAISALRKHYGTARSMILDGITYTPSQVEDALKASLDAITATATAEAKFHDAVAAERAAHARGDAMYAALKAFVITQFKNLPSVLAEFSITLNERKRPDLVTTAAAVEKRRLTRAARHTMGRRQKAKIKG
jgi:hypothetical protein